MIKKYMNQLYKEIEQIRRQLVSGKLKYFGDTDFGNGNYYTVLMKDGTYFYIAIGTKNIPKVKKKNIVFIEKMIDYKLSDKNSKYLNCDYIDSDRGFYRYPDYKLYKNYMHDKMIKYGVNFNSEYDTDYFK